MLFSNVEFTDSNHGIHYLNPKYIFGMIPPQKSEIFKCYVQITLFNFVVYTEGTLKEMLPDRRNISDKTDKEL